MITLAVVLLLGATSVLGSCPFYCPPKCTLSWVTYPREQVKFLAHRRNIPHEDACKEACEADQTCFNVDWNFIDNSCWYGTAHNPTPRYPDLGVNHHDLTRDCPENCNLDITWTSFPLTQVKFLVKKSSITSEEACKAGCEADSKCWSIDWNFNNNACFFGSEKNPTLRFPDSGVNHYDLARACAETLVDTLIDEGSELIRTNPLTTTTREATAGTPPPI